MMTAGGRDQSGPYPTRDEYDIAMARWRESIWDAEILRFAQDDNRQWNTGWANAQQPSQQAPSPSQFWNTGTLAAPGSVQAPPYAGPPIPFPPTLNEDDDPLPLSSPGSNASLWRKTKGTAYRYYLFSSSDYSRCRYYAGTDLHGRYSYR